MLRPKMYVVSWRDERAEPCQSMKLWVQVSIGGKSRRTGSCGWVVHTNIGDRVELKPQAQSCVGGRSLHC